MGRHCGVTFRVNGTEYNTTFEVDQDQPTEEQLEEAARPAIEAALSRAVANPHGSTVVVQYIAVDGYVNGGRTNANANGARNGSFEANERFNLSSPLTFNFASVSGRSYVASVPIGSETRRVQYTWDGTAGSVSDAEALSFLRNLKISYGLSPDADINSLAADHPLRTLINATPSPSINFGSDGNMSMSQVLAAAERARTASPDPSSPGGTNPSDPNYTYAPSESLETRRGRLRDRMGNLDAILAVLAAAIAGGNLDALRSFAILAGARTGLAVADVATIVADSMRNLNIGDDASRAALVTAMRDGNPTGPNAGTRAAESRSRIQEIQNQLQQNDQLRQMLMQSLRDNMSRKESSDTFTDSILSHADREASHYRWS